MEIRIERGSAPTAKRLPRNPENGYFKGDFEANGKRYFIAHPENGFPLSRDSAFGKFMAMYWYGGTFNTPISRRAKMDEVINGIQTGKYQWTDLALANKEETDAITQLSKAKFDFSLYLCTTFIFEDGEKLTDPWEQARADAKIQDWQEYAREDFFELATVFIAAYNSISAQFLEAIAQAIEAATIQPRAQKKYIFDTASTKKGAESLTPSPK